MPQHIRMARSYRFCQEASEMLKKFRILTSQNMVKPIKTHHMRTYLSLIMAYAFLWASCIPAFAQQKTPSKAFTIAFGSCGHQQHELPIFNLIAEHRPDLFVFLGDNIYGDTYDLDTLKAKYRQLGEKTSYQNLKKHTNILATWDDHDFGWNDIGRHYPHKEASKAIFLDFFEEPPTSERWQHGGIYTDYYFQLGKMTLQLILLDNRTFRDDLKPFQKTSEQDRRYFYDLDYAPYTATETDSTLLGEAQWKWLETTLQKPADIRIIGTGTQFGIEYNGYEAWANFPHEQQRMLELIKSTGANGVFFISGDVHYAELSKLAYPGLYPVYDFTSSGLSSTWHFATPNAARIEGPVMDNHFGKISIHWRKKPVTIQFEVFDIHNNERFEYTIPLSELQLTR